MIIDLHTHSYFSDGALTPLKLLQSASLSGINIIALTDHDTTDGIDDAIVASQKTGVTLIPGIELDVTHQPGDLHLLGYGLDHKQPEVKKRLDSIKAERDNRNQAIIDKMAADGMNVSYKEFTTMFDRSMYTRIHIAEYLVKKGYGKSVKGIFERYIGTGRKFFVEKSELSFEDAVNIIKTGGGISVLAHPLSLYISWGKLGTRLAEWKEAGLDGVEAYHPGAKPRKAERIAGIADELGLLLSGGSDYHNDSFGSRSLGKIHGDSGVPYDKVRPLLDYISSNSSWSNPAETVKK